MLRRAVSILVLSGLASLACAAVLLQEDFTPAQVGTIPASLTASYDPAVDTIVTAYGSVQPAPPADHTGGDGFVMPVGDRGAGGGAYNWVYPAALAAQTDVQVSAWVYVDWTTMDSPTPLERDYMILIRQQTNINPQTAPSRNGYIFAITANSSWTGISPNPTNFRAFIMKKESTGTHTVLGSESAADVTTGWHKVVFHAFGTNLRAYIDGTLVCSATDATYASGYSSIGYYEDNGSAASFPFAAAFDNLLIETPTAEVTDWNLF